MKSYVFGYDFYVDLVFCIDARARMNPLINTLKENISCFYRDFIEIMDKKHRKIGNINHNKIAQFLYKLNNLYL